MAAYFFVKNIDLVSTWVANDFRVICIDTADYTVDLLNHDFLDDVAAAARVAVSGALASKTLTFANISARAAAILDAADITITGVTGDQFEALLIYYHTGVDATAKPFIWISGGTGLPLTPTGNDVTTTWGSSGSKIIALQNPV